MARDASSRQALQEVPTVIRVRPEGGDRYSVEVGRHTLVVDQPDTGDAGPTPTDLFIASLAACTAHYAGRFFARHGVDADGFEVSCVFEMAEDRPARVRSIAIHLQLPDAFPDELRDRLRAVVEHCTVHNSIQTPPDILIALEARECVA
jgi:putative redox protein